MAAVVEACRSTVTTAVGRHLAFIVDTLERPDGKLHLHSGHDWTVGPLKLAVGPWADQILLNGPGQQAGFIHEAERWPAFCSNIAFELWSAREDDAVSARTGRRHHFAADGAAGALNEGRHVRVVWNGTEVIDMPCSVAGKETCRLDDFKRMVAKLCVGDFRSECMPIKES